MSKYCIWRLHFHLQKMVLCHTWGVQHKNSWSTHQTWSIVTPDIGFATVVENCYWAFLKLFVGSTVCKYSHQNNNTENMALSSEMLYQSWCPSVTTADTKSFIPDNTNNTTDNLDEYIYSKAYSQTNKIQRSLWMVIFYMLEQYTATSNVTLETWTQAAVWNE